MKQPRTYAAFTPPTGLRWVWWVALRPARSAMYRLKRMYRRRWPPREMSRYIGLVVRVVEENRLLPPIGSVGVVARSELRDGDRVYVIEFEEMTLVASLPAPRIIEVLGPGSPAGSV